MKILFRHKTFVYFRQKFNLAFEYFISRKTLKSVVQGKKVSKPIVRISIISIALAVIVNLITLAVVTGFQQEVRQKISGFGAHIFVMRSGENSVYESESIRIEQSFLDDLKSNPDIKSVYPVGYKPVLFQSDKTEIKYKLPSGEDTTEIHQNVFGAMIKGVNEEFNKEFFETHLKEGKLPNYSTKESDNQIVISRTVAKALNFQVNDTVTSFFVKNNPVRKEFVIAGIYSTGLEEFDKKIALGKLSLVQELNDWGIKASINVADTLIDGQLLIKAKVNGGNGNIRYDWGNGFERYSGFAHCPLKDTTIRLIVSDYFGDINSSEASLSLADTAYLKIKIKGNAYSFCDFEHNDFDELERTYLSEDGTSYSLEASQKKVIIKEFDGTGSSHNYSGGFEIILNDWETLDETHKEISRQIDFIPNDYDEVLKTTSIKHNQREIFVWLGFLDINVIIILVLMILIGIINMGSALLVLILIRSNFIGMMKAMGATNWSIRKIFLIQATFLISRGMLWGNIIGVGLCLIQKYFGIFKLNAEVYYLSQVPIELTFSHWLFLNIGTLLVCVIALIVPSIVITRIDPVKAIKFD